MIAKQNDMNNSIQIATPSKSISFEANTLAYEDDTQYKMLFINSGDGYPIYEITIPKGKLLSYKLEAIYTISEDKKARIECV